MSKTNDAGLPRWMGNRKPADDLFRTIELLKDEHEIRRFLYAIVTAPERSNIANRWRAVMMLYEGYEVAEIHKITGIAKGTISDVKKMVVQVSEADEVCRAFHKRLSDNLANESANLD